MKRVPVYRIEGKGWWQKPMRELRKKARAGEGPVQLELGDNVFRILPEKAKESLYLPCKYCQSDKCKIAELRPGMVDHSFAFPWTRRNPPATSARIELTPCEQQELKATYAALGIRTQAEAAKKAEPEPEKLKPVLTARQTAERILAACSTKKGRTVQRLCELAGVDPSDLVDRVLDFLSDSGKIAKVLGSRWILT